MKTVKLYQSDVYMKEWDSKILDIQNSEKDIDSYSVILDRTAFFPEGGGQSCDTGYIGDLKVSDVQEESGLIRHTVICKKTDDISRLKASGEVRCRLDWDRRFDNMQRHLGEHILSGAFYNMYGGVNRGFHMGSEYMTADISFENSKDGIIELTDEMAARAELRANETIWSDKPVRAYFFNTRKEAEKLPLRKALAFDEDISIVTVGDPDNPDDCVACCGTHPSTSGQVGLIKIYKVEKYKSMFRVYFDAGRRAMSDYDFKHDMLTELSNRFSSSVEDLPAKIESREESIKNLKDKLYKLKKALIENECKAIDDIIAGTNDVVIVYTAGELTIDDLADISKKYSGSCDRLIMLYSPVSCAYMLVSGGEPDCGRLVKEYASFYGGRGGGRSVSARAVFSSASDAELFADLMKKHLKK